MRSDKITSAGPVLVVITALAASLGGLSNDFVYDDIPIIRDNARLHALANWREIITRPYWPPPFVEQLYRPLASFSLALQYALGGGQPIVFRLASYALYALCAIGVLHLARRVVGPRAALLAALLFAAHPVHVEAAALGVNQGELIVGFLGLLMVLRYVDGRRRGDLGARDWVAISLMYAAGALTKENGFVLPALLVAAEIVVGEGSTLRERAAATWRGFTALALVGAGIALCRAFVLHGSAVGASVAHPLRGLGLWERLLVMLQVVPIWFRLLAWPAHLQADYGAGDIHALGSFGAAELAGVGLVFASAALMWVARKRAPAVSFGLAWCVIGLLPVSNLVPTGILVAERTLFLPSVGFLIAVAGAGEWLAARSRWSGATTRRVLSVVAVAFVVLGVVRSESRHLVWNSRHLVVKRP